jgi:hypothetical protein
MLPPEPRLPGARELIDEDMYFVVHAPRQTGKTTVLNALARDLSADGRHVALRFSCERAEPAGNDYGAATGAILEAVDDAAFAQGLSPELMPPSRWPETSAESRLKAGLTAWARTCPLPIVLFFDEIDALAGTSLISVLRQLRDGYTARPAPFPASVVLCGVRNVRDYKAASGGNAEALGTSSPFNIAVESLRIADFTRDQVAELYGQHTAETGQEFTPEATARAFDYSQGQPWLVNSIAREITREMRVEPPEPITVSHVDQAKERLILARPARVGHMALKYPNRAPAAVQPR